MLLLPIDFHLTPPLFVLLLTHLMLAKTCDLQLAPLPSAWTDGCNALNTIENSSEPLDCFDPPLRTL